VKWKKVMTNWWDRKWRLVLFLVLLPILLVSIIGVLLFPEIPLIELVLYSLIFSVLVVQTFRMLRTVKIWGLRKVILVLAGITLVALLLVLVRKIL